MKKEKLLAVMLLFVLVVVIGFGMVSAAIKTSTAKYSTGDSVYLVSTSDPLCYSGPQKVKVFVVENQSFSGGEGLDEVRDASSEVPNTRFSREQLLADASAGVFSVIIDCNNNGVYDMGEPLYANGFSVVAKKGVGKVSEALKISDSSWMYDPEAPLLTIPVLQVSLLAQHESILLTNLSVEFSNNPALDISLVDFYIDKNSDGKSGSSDVKIGSFVPSGLIANRAKVTVALDYVLEMGTSEKLLVVYQMKQGVAPGTYSMKLMNIFGTGQITNEQISFAGLSKESSLLMVSGAKSCLGTTLLALNPSSSYDTGIVTLQVSNLTGCDGMKVSFRDQPCYLPSRELKTCVLTAGGCSSQIVSSESKTYFACVDKNKDSDFVDFGESAPADYSRLVRDVVIVDNSEEEVKNQTGESDQAGVGADVTGRVISGIGEGLITNNSFLVLLEVTLLLILFVLIMIFFKLGRTTNGQLLDDEDEEAHQEVDNDDDEDESRENVVAKKVIRKKGKEVRKTKEASTEDIDDLFEEV